MAATRRPAEESRTLLIEAAVEIINSEGYAALSARNLAGRVGLKRQIVHYYFRTMEDLLLAVVRHYGNHGLARLSAAMQSGNPLRAIWDVQADASATSHAFMAMARHQPAIREEISAYFRKFRDIQVEAVARFFSESGADAGITAEAATIIVRGVAEAMHAETMLGDERGHAEARAAMERWIDGLGRP